MILKLTKHNLQAPSTAGCDGSLADGAANDRTATNWRVYYCPATNANSAFYRDVMHNISASTRALVTVAMDASFHVGNAAQLVAPPADASLAVTSDRHDGSGDTKRRGSPTGDDAIVVVTGDSETVSVCDKTTASRQPLTPDVIAGYFSDLAANDAPPAGDLAGSHAITSDEDANAPYVPTDDTEELIKRIDDFLNSSTTTPAALSILATQVTKATQITPATPATQVTPATSASRVTMMTLTSPVTQATSASPATHLTPATPAPQVTLTTLSSQSTQKTPATLATQVTKATTATLTSQLTPATPATITTEGGGLEATDTTSAVTPITKSTPECPVTAQKALPAEATTPMYSASFDHRRSAPAVVRIDSHTAVTATAKLINARKSKSRTTRCTPNKTTSMALMMSRDVEKKSTIPASSSEAVVRPPVSHLNSAVSTPKSLCRSLEVSAAKPRLTNVVRTCYLCKPSKRDQKAEVRCSTPAERYDKKTHIIDYPAPIRTSSSGWATRRRRTGPFFRRKSAS